MKKYIVIAYEDGTIAWHNEQGVLDCNFGPAITTSNGEKRYYINGQLLTKEEFELETTGVFSKTFLGNIYYYNAFGQLHREGSPAIIGKNGNEAYYINGELHNEKGPAMIQAHGKIKLYYIHGKRFSYEEFVEYTTKQDEKIVNVSQWLHIQCWKCKKNGAIENDENKILYYCPHCAATNNIPKLNK